MNKKTISNWLLVWFTVVTCFVLAAYRRSEVKPTELEIKPSVFDTINKYVNPDTSKYIPESIEAIRVTPQFADSLSVAVLCNGVDYWQSKEDEALVWHNKWAKLATKFYKVKDYDSYKAVLWKADSCLSVADEYEDLKLDLERSVEHYELGKYGEEPILLEFQLTSDTDTLKDNRFLLTSEFKPLNHKYNGRN